AAAQAEPEEDVAEASEQEEEADYDGPLPRRGKDGQFFSPLVRSIAEKEGISQKELEAIEGSGAQGRVTKEDVVSFIESRAAKQIEAEERTRKEEEAAQKAAEERARKEEEAAKKAAEESSAKEAAASSTAEKAPTGLSKPVQEKAAPAKRDFNEIKAGEIHVNRPKDNIQVIKMDRMRKVIAEHMIRSKQTSAHVTTFGEADVTTLVKFRNKHKDAFYANNGFKLTFTPFFIEATIQALREFPLVNSSVNGDEIHLKRDINYGIAVALGESGSGGLVVPVIKNAGDMNLHGIARSTHNLAERARQKQLSPDDLSGGTFTLTNYGSVGNLMGTPIINQPQVAIFGTGVIQKRPMVMEVDGNAVIAIRHMVYLSMSYDHRIIDGALGGAFVQRVKELLENFDPNRSL
ncbi:MAG: dihydrolipoamide acetyltransferase family protein, partial [Cyclonatronaceae bacterium]